MGGDSHGKHGGESHGHGHGHGHGHSHHVVHNPVISHPPIEHHHVGEFKAPDWRIYKVENAPELLEVQEKLARRGLKDPWLR